MRIFDNLRRFDFAPRQLKCNSSTNYTGSSSSSLTAGILGAVAQTGATALLQNNNVTGFVTPAVSAPVTSVKPPAAASNTSTILIVIVLAVVAFFAFSKL